MDEKRFPILSPGQSDSISWSILEPHRRQAALNHGGQTLEALANRGGLSYGELLAVLEDRKYEPMAEIYAQKRLKEVISAIGDV